MVSTPKLLAITKIRKKHKAAFDFEKHFTLKVVSKYINLYSSKFESENRNYSSCMDIITPDFRRYLKNESTF